MAIVKLPDGSKREIADGSTVMQVAESIGRGLAKAAVAGRVDGKIVDLSSKIDGGEHELAILTDRDPEALLVLRHSTAHVMAEAIQRLWPSAQLAYGPALETGFYYDIALEQPISANDFPRIEKEMEKIVAENRPFTRYDLPPDQGMERLKKEGNKYKIDNAERAMKGGARSLLTSPCQFDAATLMTLNPLIFPVAGMCGPMQRSSQFLSFSPVTYHDSDRAPPFIARSALSILYSVPSFLSRSMPCSGGRS